MESWEAKAFVAFALDRKLVSREQVDRCRRSQRRLPNLEIPELLIWSGALDSARAEEISRTLASHGIVYKLKPAEAVYGRTPPEGQQALRDLVRQADAVEPPKPKRPVVTKRAVFVVAATLLLAAVVVGVVEMVRSRNEAFRTHLAAARAARDAGELPRSMEAYTAALARRDVPEVEQELRQVESAHWVRQARAIADLGERARFLKGLLDSHSSPQVRTELAQTQKALALEEARRRYEDVMQLAAAAEKAGKYVIAYEEYLKARNLLQTQDVEKAIAQLVKHHGDVLQDARRAEALAAWQKELRRLEGKRDFYTARAEELLREHKYDEAVDYNRLRFRTEQEIRGHAEKMPR